MERSPFRRGGEGGIRTHVTFPSNAFRVRPVMTTSIPLLIFNAVQFKHYLAIIQQNRTIVKCFAANFYFFVKSSRIFKTCMQKSFQNRKINIHPHSGWYFIFGHSPNTTGNAQVRLLLACQPRNRYLLTHKWVPWVKYAQLIAFFVSFQLF